MLQVLEHELLYIPPTLTCMHQHVFTCIFPQALPLLHVSLSLFHFQGRVIPLVANVL